MIIRLMLLIAGLTAPSFQLSSQTEGYAVVPNANPVTILSGNVSATATLKSKYEDRGFTLHQYEIVIKHGAEEFRYSCGLEHVANEMEAISILKNSIAWKDGFLFAREVDECGTGWRCPIEQVFALRSGKLVHVGEIPGRQNDGPGCNYKDGYFIDFYNKLEDNDLTDHADAPGIVLYSKYLNGKLQVDLNRTWTANHAAIDRYRNDLEHAQKISQSAESKLTIKWRLLAIAVIEKYCGRDRELGNTISLAKSSLDHSTMAAFLSLLEKVIPGELPTSR